LSIFCYNLNPMIYLIFSLIILGILNAAYLYWQHYQHRRHNRAMACPLGGKCEEVVGSKYGAVLGVPNDLLGIAFYLGLSALMIFNLTLILPLVMPKLILLAALASLVFTTYLLFVQAFILKKWCAWCLISAIINYAIFISILIYL